MAATKTVYVELVAQTKKLTSGLNKADQRVKKSTALMKKMGAAVASLFALSSLKRAARATVEYARSITDLKRAFGLTVDQGQRLIFTADALGLEIRAFTESMKEVKKRATEARKSSKDIEAAFNAIGITPKQAEAMDDLELVVEALKGIGKAAPAERNFLADRIFGGMGAEVFQAVFNDLEHFNDVLGEAGDVSTTAFDVTQLDKLEAGSAKISHHWEQIKLDLLDGVIPGLEESLEFIVDHKKELGVIGERIKFAFKWFTPLGLGMQMFDKVAGSIADHWWEISHAIRDAFEWVKRIARSVSGTFLDAIGFGPDDPINQPAPPSTALAPFSMVPTNAGPLSNDAFTQNNYYQISGLTADQMDARARRQADTARKAARR